MLSQHIFKARQSFKEGKPILVVGTARSAFGYLALLSTVEYPPLDEQDIKEIVDGHSN